MGETLQFVVTSEYNGVKAGRYLRTVCKLSARTLSLLKRTEGALTADGELLRTIDLLKEGSVIEIKLPVENNSILATPGNLDVLYEDKFMLVVNKPSDMPVHPVKTHQEDTLANIIAYKYKDTAQEFVFRAVNRLDRDTSGVVIIAKDRHTASVLQTTDISKTYIAVCHGSVAEKGTINKPIKLSEDSKIVRVVAPDGQTAVTHFERLSFNEIASVVKLSLETGRTHQIRCHMSHLGHPLFGDDLYGGSVDLIDRQALHCISVSFKHPFENNFLEINTELPSDIINLIKELKL